MSFTIAVRNGARKRLKRRSFSKDAAVDRSLRHSMRDAVAFSIMSGAGETYFSAFALFLKATTAQIGLLASLPPLLASFAQLLSAWMGRRTGRRKGIILAGATFQGLMLIPLAFLPLAYPAYALPILITCVIFYYAGANLAVPQWSSLMGDLVPERRRGRFFALRTRLSSMTALIALVTAGYTLHLFSANHATLNGYVTLFLVAAVARLASVFHLSQMYDPPGHVAALEVPVGKTWRERLSDAPFLRFSLFFASMQFAVAIASPFFTVHMLRDLKFSYLEFMINTAVAVLVQFLTLNKWGRIGDVFGNRLILVSTGFIIPALPLLWLFSGNFWYLLGVQALSGVAWAGFNLSAGNFLYDLVPPARRATFLAVHNVIASIGLFLGATTGGLLAAVLPSHTAFNGLSWSSGLFSVFLLSSLVRMGVAAFFLPRLKEVRPVKPLSVGGLIFRVVRFNALQGLFFDIVGAKRRTSGQ